MSIVTSINNVTHLFFDVFLVMIKSLLSRRNGANATYLNYFKGTFNNYQFVTPWGQESSDVKRF